MVYNLGSPNQITEPCDLKDLIAWFESQVRTIKDAAVQDVLKIVAAHLDSFIRWPAKAVLLWSECDRIKPRDAKQRYHKYPSPIRELAASKKVVLDSRPNGPAIAAFRLAEGQRPTRFGSKNSWSIHHLYSGKFPYVSKSETTHAIKQCKHFTQSAGLIATHPIGDALVDEFPAFAWLLRAEAFKRFGYDPDAVFTDNHDELGFEVDRNCEILL